MIYYEITVLAYNNLEGNVKYGLANHPQSDSCKQTQVQDEYS